MIKEKINFLFQEDSLKTKIAKGIAWSFLGTMISKMMMLCVFVIIARIVTIEEYGEIGILRNAILTFSLIALASFGVTATRYIAKYKDINKEKTNRLLTLTRILTIFISLFLSIIIFLFSDIVALYVLNNELLSTNIKYLSIAIFFTSLNGYQNGALSGFERFKEISIINIINGILSFPILLIGAYYWGVNGVVFSLIVISFLIWLCSFYYLEKVLKEEKIKLCFKNLKKELGILYRFSLPSFLSSIMFTPTFFILNSLLAHQSNGYTQLGIFSAVFFFSTLSQALIHILGQVLYPYAIKEFNNSNKSFEYINIIIPWILGILINIPLILFPDLFSLMFGENYMNESFYLSLILIAYSNIMTAFGQGIGRNFAAANLMWWSAFSNFVWSLFCILTAYFFIEYGSVGVSFSLIIAYCLNFILFVPLYIKKNLITLELLFNKYLLLIWLLLIILVLIPIYLNDLYLVKILCLLVFCYLLLILIKKSIIKKKESS